MLLAFSYLGAVQAQDHSAEVSKVGETPYIVLSFYYIMEYIYLYISTLFQPSS